MALFEDKWSKLASDFQKALKGEALWSKEIQGLNRELAKLTKEIDTCEAELSCCCNNSRGFKQEDAADYLLKLRSKVTALVRGGFDDIVQGQLNGTDKDAKPKTYRALKVLLTGIKELSTLAEYKLPTFEQQVGDIGRQIQSAERTARVEALALAQVKKAVAKSAACIQKIKGTPTPAQWKEQMAQGMTRDVVMGLRSLRDAFNKGSIQDIPNPAAHFQHVSPWNTAQPASEVNDTDDEQAILQKVKAWSQLIKAIVADYGDQW